MKELDAAANSDTERDFVAEADLWRAKLRTLIAAERTSPVVGASNFTSDALEIEQLDAIRARGTE